MKKGITIVFMANIMNMLFSVISSFVLPKYLSIESYGYYKIFALYTGYLGIAHFGFSDGIYLKYGGRKLEDIDSKELLLSSTTLRNLQLCLMVTTITIALILNNSIMFFLAVSFVPINMISYYKSLFQATGEFKKYSIILSIIPIVSFLCNMFLIFIARTDRYELYILVTIISNLFIYIFFEKQNGRIYFFAFDKQLLKNNIKSGITLTIGNLVSTLITSIDRWFIQFLMEISAFSYYSFAVSVENLFNVCVSAVTTTLYNYLCRVKEIEKLIRLKSLCIIMGVYLVSVAFPVKFIIKIWLQKYEASIPCLFVLISAHSFYFVIKAIYVNLYKARGQQKHYLIQILIILTIAIITNLIAYFEISKTKEAFACASLITAVIWYFICFIEFEDIRGKVQENVLLVLSTIFYLLFGLFLDNAVAGFIGYIITITFVSLILSKDNLLSTIRMVIEIVIQLLGKFRKNERIRE